MAEKQQQFSWKTLGGKALRGVLVAGVPTFLNILRTTGSFSGVQWDTAGVDLLLASAVGAGMDGGYNYIKTAPLRAQAAVTRLLILLAFLLPFATTAMAAPFLTCKQAPVEDGVTKYIVVWKSFTPKGTTSEVPLQFQDSEFTDDYRYVDLAELVTTEGVYKVEGYTENVWGRSDPTPFEFTKTLPGPMLGPELVPSSGQ